MAREKCEDYLSKRRIQLRIGLNMITSAGPCMSIVTVRTAALVVCQSALHSLLTSPTSARPSYILRGKDTRSQWHFEIKWDVISICTTITPLNVV